MRKYGLSHRVGQESSDYQAFYYDMYLPYLRSRYPKEATSVTLRRFRQLCRSGSLILVDMKGSPVAGGLVLEGPDMPTFKLMGIQDGDLNYVKRGAGGALYYAVIVECQKKGYQRLNVLGGRPFLNDGLTRWKKSLLAQFDRGYDSDADHFWLSVPEGSLAGAEFLRNNPFLCLSQAGTLELARLPHGPADCMESP